MKEFSLEFIKLAHKHSSSHREEILSGDLCGCFYCKKTFLPLDIEFWIDEPDGSETATCPYCSIDSVLGSNLPIEEMDFLKAMYNYWFSEE